MPEGEKLTARAPQPGAAPEWKMPQMPTFSPKQISEARARNDVVAKRVAAHVGWRLQETATLLPSAFRAYWLVAEAELLVAPQQTPGRPEVRRADQAMQIARSDALVLAIGGSEHAPMVSAAVGIWGRDRNDWTPGLQAWIAQDGQLWFVPNRFDQLLLTRSFRATTGRFFGSHLPWLSDADRTDGYARANRLLLRDGEC